MPRLWLPLGTERPVRNEHDEIVLKLRRLGVHVPGAHKLEIGQLREILAWQEEKARQGEPPRPPPRLSREEVQQGLREFLAFRQLRREGRRRFY